MSVAHCSNADGSLNPFGLIPGIGYRLALDDFFHRLLIFPLLYDRGIWPRNRAISIGAADRLIIVGKPVSVRISFRRRRDEKGIAAQSQLHAIRQAVAVKIRQVGIAAVRRVRIAQPHKEPARAAPEPPLNGLVRA